MSALNSETVASPIHQQKNEINENNNQFVSNNSPKKVVLDEIITAEPIICPLQPQSETNKRKTETFTPDATEPPKKKQTQHQKKFVYGNYDRYYGYRIPKDSHDIRLDVFREHAESLFQGADILDVGCNSGLVTIAVSRDLGTRSAIGIDIDASLIRQAKGRLHAERRRVSDSPTSTELSYPRNVTFIKANYVLSDPKLLVLEQPKFDTILFLSTSKWVHLNFGDAGLQLAFRRIFRQLRPGGRLVLEAQDWKSYRKRKRLSEIISSNFAAIQMHPIQFKAYLLGPEVGFQESYTLQASSEHLAKGFRRPIQVFVKAGERKLISEPLTKIIC